MSGYIGKSQGVTQVDGYNRAEADAEFVQVTGDTMTGPLNILAPGSSAVGSAGYFLHVAGSSAETDPERYMIGFSHGNNTNPTNVRAAVGLKVSGGGAGNLVFETGASAGGQLERMRIDSAGRVTMPFQPAFSATSPDGNVTLSYNTALALPTTHFNRGNHYNTSTSKFTAPVAGVYQFNLVTYLNSDTATVVFLVNDAQIGGSDPDNLLYKTTSSPFTMAMSICASLSANDTVSVSARQGSGSTTFYVGHTTFSGFLVG